jgi:ABC-type multidrug transport system ATPase subunit
MTPFISAHDLSKKFNRKWVFKNLSLTIELGETIGITGNNGSGKSTLALTLLGYMIPDKGKIIYGHSDETSAPQNLFSFAGPYLDLPEFLTLAEVFKFHFSFTPLHTSLTLEEALNLVNLPGSPETPFSHFSSGMKQKTRLALAFFTDRPGMILDEPLSNLDASGKAWYGEMIKKFGTKKTTLVFSNSQPEELAPCGRIVALESLSVISS